MPSILAAITPRVNGSFMTCMAMSSNPLATAARATNSYFSG